MKEYKVLMVTTEVLEQRLNALAQQKWSPILMHIYTQTDAKGVASATLVLEKDNASITDYLKA
jgi:hypothetical protein